MTVYLIDLHAVINSHKAAILRRNFDHLVQYVARPMNDKANHRGPGRPTKRTRNDRLLALFRLTPAHLPHLQRCRIAAQHHADEQPAAEHHRVMPVTTARDAIAEALRHEAEAKGELS